MITGCNKSVEFSFTEHSNYVGKRYFASPPPIGKARRPRFFNSAVVSVVRWRALIVVTRARTTYTNPRYTATRVFKSGICVPIVRRRRRLRCDPNIPNRRGDIHIH